MMDQYNMEQYNKETSQIHAPADLIRRTREAVREEEQRIARERLQQNTTARSKRSNRKVYKWALPVAAAVCMILLNVSGIMLRCDMRNSGSGSSMDMALETAPSGGNDMGMQAGAADWPENAVTTVDDTVDMGSNYDMAEEAEEEYTSEDYDGGQPTDTVASAESGVSADSPLEDNFHKESELKETNDSYIKSTYENDLWIERVEEIPDFYNKSDTECVTIQSVALYVGKDFDGAWIAYTEVDADKYVISTELTEEEISREEFARKAYAILTETTGKAD